MDVLAMPHGLLEAMNDVIRDEVRARRRAEARRNR